MSSPCPRLRDLDSALSSLSWGEVKRMAIHLHHSLTLPALDRIGEDHSTAGERCLYCMKLWLDGDLDACWAKVVTALLEIGKHQLAMELESRYCAQAFSLPVPAVCKHRSSVSTYGEQRIQPQALPLLDTASNPKAIMTSPAMEEPFVFKHSCDMDELERAAKDCLDLEEQFVSLVTDVQFYFSEMESESPNFLKRFRLTLENLPMFSKFKHMHFLKEKKMLISAAPDVREIFNILSPYWNHFDYSLLEKICITMEFDNQEIKKKVKKKVKFYITLLTQFEQETTVQIYFNATFDDRKIPPEFSEVIIKLDRRPSECTLYDIRKFKESLACRASLNAYCAQLKRVGVGSVVMVLAVHRDVLDMFVKTAEDFQLEIGSNILSVKRNDTAVESDSHLLASQKSAMAVVQPHSCISGVVEGSRTRLSLRSADSGFSSSSSRSLLTPSSILSLFCAALKKRKGLPSRYLSHSDISYNDLPKPTAPLRRVRSMGWSRSDQLPSNSLTNVYPPREPEVSTPGEGNISKILLEAVGCLMHQENCRIPKCPCKQVKRRFQHILPQTRQHMQEETDKIIEEVLNGDFDPTDRRQQMRLSLSSQNFNKDIHAHYHMTSRSHIRQSRGSQRFVHRRRSKSMDLTPIVEQPESCATTPGVIIPDGARGLLCGPVFSPAITPSGETFRVLSPITPSAAPITSPVLLREISLSADNLPSLCLNDCPMAATPLMQLANRPLGSASRSPLSTTQHCWSNEPTVKPTQPEEIPECHKDSTSSDEGHTSDRYTSQDSSSSLQTTSTHPSGQLGKAEATSVFDYTVLPQRNYGAQTSSSTTSTDPEISIRRLRPRDLPIHPQTLPTHTEQKEELSRDPDSDRTQGESTSSHASPPTHVFQASDGSITTQTLC